MYKYLFLGLILLFSACNQEKKEIIEKFENGSQKLIVIETNGNRIRYEYYESGEKRSMIPLKDSLEDGKYVLWYENGGRWAEGNYKNGLREDTAIEYYRNGERKNIRYYVNDKMKVYRRYDTLGRKTTEINDIEDIMYAWYPNGNLEAKIPRVEGEFLEYHANGSTKFKGPMKRGMKNGLYYYFNSEADSLKTVLYEDDRAIDSTLFK